MTNLLEIYKNVNKELVNHLADRANDKIIFSGKFGTGKTTYLRKFEEENKEKYNIFHLNPVNYSVASNEDIFKLIKYDIIYELRRKFKYEFRNVELSIWDTLPIFALKNLDKILAPILLTTQIGGVGYLLWKDLREQVDKFSAFHKEKAIDTEPEKEIQDFEQEILEREGSIFEQNVITSLITDALQGLKEENEEVENILIIDDLDRIDPAHIFRLFNVFATHFTPDNSEESQKRTNKFGFDRIIFVCDIKNLKSIFHHFYGADTDFFGYIDKFYRKSIFKFDALVKREVNQHLERLFKGLRVLAITSSAEFSINESFKNDLVNLLLRLLPTTLLQDELNMRIIQKTIDYENLFSEKQIVNFDNDYSIQDIHILCCYFFKVLIKIFGSAERVIDVFRKVSMDFASRLGVKDKWLLAMAVYPQFLYLKYKNKSSESIDYFVIDEPNHRVKIYLNEYRHEGLMQVSINKIINLDDEHAQTEEPLTLAKIDIFQEFAKSFQLLVELGYPN